MGWALGTPRQFRHSEAYTEGPARSAVPAHLSPRLPTSPSVPASPRPAHLSPPSPSPPTSPPHPLSPPSSPLHDSSLPYPPPVSPTNRPPLPHSQALIAACRKHLQRQTFGKGCPQVWGDSHMKAIWAARAVAGPQSSIQAQGSLAPRSQWSPSRGLASSWPERPVCWPAGWGAGAGLEAPSSPRTTLAPQAPAPRLAVGLQVFPKPASALQEHRRPPVPQNCIQPVALQASHGWVSVWGFPAPSFLPSFRSPWNTYCVSGTSPPHKQGSVLTDHLCRLAETGKNEVGKYQIERRALPS